MMTRPKENGQGWISIRCRKDHVEIFPIEESLERQTHESRKKKKRVRGLNVSISDTE